jgi:predicted metallo-beta-lactamase superfamily hydrolase
VLEQRNASSEVSRTMPALRVTPIGFESFGVRSMCTFVETPDVRILIDAGVALGQRFGKLPHPREYRALYRCRTKIRDFAEKADVIIVSHYHNDHHTPNYTETVWLGSSAEESERIYRDKVVLVKDIRNSINFSQRRRGWMFQRFIKRIGGKCEVADGKAFEYGGTKIKISPPVPHGEMQSGLGWVIMASVESREWRLMHASDVQGPMAKQTARIILKENPDQLILGGPPVYLEGVKVDKSLIQEGMQNAARIAGKVRTFVFEHHLLRSEDWRNRANFVYEVAGKAGNIVCTAAEYLGESPQILEAIRPELYEKEPPSEEFLKWSKLKREKQRLAPPPIER